MLRAKLPRRIEVKRAERARLLKLGKRLGPAIKNLITIVHPRTFARWVAEERTSGNTKRKKPGRPRKFVEIRALIVRLAKENLWGKMRVIGELKKLGIRCLSPSTVRRILIENGFDPAPKRRRDGAWHEFVRRHFKTLWACDFFSTKVWTTRGLVEFYVLFFLHVESRRVHIAGMTPNPDGRWRRQQAKNLVMHFDEQGAAKPSYIVRDRDSKFTNAFCSIVESEGIKWLETPPHTPNMNPFAERWVQSVKTEALDHFLIFGERHLRHILSEYLAHYHGARPHQGVGNELLTKPENAPEPIESLGAGDVVCRERLGGLLRHYERKAA